MNKKDCLLKIRSRKLLSIVETTDNHEITLVIKLGDKVVKQSQFDILLTEINKINNKMDEGFNKVNHRLDKVETRLDAIESDVSELKKDVSVLKEDVSEIKIVLKKHDDAMVEHGWFNKSNMN